MLVATCFVLWMLIISSVTCEGVNITYSETTKGYKITETRVECFSLNATIAKVHCQTVFKSRFNKHAKVFMETFQQADDIDLMVDYMKGSLRTSQYPGPGAKFHLSLCKMMRLNLWGFANYTTNFGNLTQCPIKPGIYYFQTLDNNDDDQYSHKNLPKSIPTGDYRANITIEVNKIPAITVISYVSYQEKPSNIN